MGTLIGYTAACHALTGYDSKTDSNLVKEYGRYMYTRAQGENMDDDITLKEISEVLVELKEYTKNPGKLVVGEYDMLLKKGMATIMRVNRVFKGNQFHRERKHLVSELHDHLRNFNIARMEYIFTRAKERLNIPASQLNIPPR